MSEKTEALIQQLRDGGFDAAADSVRDAEIAQSLHDAGRADLAESLQGTSEPAGPPKSPAETEAEAFLAELKDKQEASWTSAGKLLGN